MINAGRLDDLLDLLCDEIQALGVADGYLINLLDASGKSLTCLKLRYPTEFQNLEKSYLGYKFALNNGQLNARTMASGEVMRVTEDNATSEEVNILRYWKIREMTGVPLCAPGARPANPTGVLILLKQEGSIPDQDLARVTELVNLFHGSLSRWLRFAHLEMLHEESKASVAENRRHLQFLDEMTSLTSVDKIYELFANELFRQLPLDLISFSLVEDGQMFPRKVVASKPKFESVRREWENYLKQNPYSLDPTSSGSAHVLQRNKVMLFPDYRDIQHLPMALHDRKSLAIVQQARTILISPIRHNKKPIGTFLSFSLDNPVTLSSADLDLIDYLTSFLGTAITNSKLYETSQAQIAEIRHLNEMLEEKVQELAQQASTDQLTGLLNFRAFEQELNKRLHEASRYGGKDSLALALIDIDHFKLFNDTNGHAAGNDILAMVAEEIGRHIRQSDQACRYGGEEFVLILPRCDLEGVRALSERIRASVEARRFETCAGPCSISLSIGCTVYRSGDDRHTLFSRADKALYRAKESGRNTVCAF
ncbi:sensor domain-containing diguanylate cyclase [Paucimonas lemoignei]|nr:sensor domain-containing diguanylate cyclase [Paucimonas lemoignei]